MIPYELAKQLKDAGFKMDEIIVPGEIKDFAVVGGLYHEGKIWKLPTLSELIEDCGDGFDRLCRYSDERGLFWKCWGNSKGLLEIYETSTPEESVAKLWLKLNKK